MKKQLLCENHPCSCVIEKGIHGKVHNFEMRCVIKINHHNFIHLTARYRVCTADGEVLKRAHTF